MGRSFNQFLNNEIELLKESGLFKSERVILGQQQAKVEVQDKAVINLCANNYLGLANNIELINAAQKALELYGYGMASVRFICGTQAPHKFLETELSKFLGYEDTILYSSCFDANTGLFETLFTEQDAIISDSLNHASIIDGIRLSKSLRLRYKNNDMQDLEAQLIAAKDSRFRVIATDGVFSMDGTIANLPAICELAEKYDALVMVDDSHSVGVLGKNGRGTAEYYGLENKVDITTGTLGKALGGASGGYTCANSTIVTWLRQKSRPYLFSNTLAPMIAYTSSVAVQLLQQKPQLLEKLRYNTQYFRTGLQDLGFNIVQGEHPIIPVMLGDAVLANKMSSLLLEEGIYVVGFSFPVVPKGLARIRVQMSAALEVAQLDLALAAFEKVGRLLKIIA